MTISVQRATVENIKEIAELFNDYRVFYQQKSDIELATAFITVRLENNESVIFYAQNEHGEILGFTQLYPTFSSVSAKPSLVLNDLFVTPTARRLGVAKTLMCVAQNFAKESGVNGLALATAENNTNAQALYESQGYKQESGFYHYFLSID